MAHEITKTDGMVLTGKPAWHGIGTVVSDAPSAVEALGIAGIGWTVDAVPIVARSMGGRFDGDHPIKSHVALMRSDTGDVLSVVGDGYRPLQNRELAETIDGLGMSRADIESAGSLRGGRNVFFLVRTASFALAGSDEVQAYTLFSNAHDGTASFRAFGTSVRVVCANTLGFATRKADRDGAGIALRHTAGMAQRIEQARDVLGIMGRQAQVFREQCEALARRQIRGPELHEFFADVYTATCGELVTNPRDKAEARQARRAQRTIGAWVANMSDRRQRIPGIDGTVWAALQSVTQWADHERTVRETETAGSSREARTHSKLFGSAAELKREAFALALARS